MEVYLDHSATTRCYEKVKEIVVKTMMEDYGNPSSLHRKGVEAEKYLKKTSETLAEILKVQEKEIFFTSGGTESNNWALTGAAMANHRWGNRIIISQIEHAAVAAPAAHLEELGFEVVRIPVDPRGVIRLDVLREALTPDTILVSVMYVNNEIGSLEPVAEIGEMVKEKCPHAYFHVDAIQAFGKYRIYPRRLQVDLLSASGHKIHGPKGSGLLYVDEKVKIQPILFGGEQQKGLRSGTENVPGIAGIAEAAAACYENLDEKVERLYTLKERFAEGIRKLPDAFINGRTGRETAPHIVNASFPGIRSEVLLHALEDKGIYVSAGSACSSNKPAPSHTLLCMGLEKERVESALRFSFCFDTTEEEIDYCLQELAELLPVLRRYVRR